MARNRMRNAECGSRSVKTARPAAHSALRTLSSVHSRRGFTLLEVLLAISLSLVLLAALYSALKLHLTFAQRGPEQARTAQLGRALMERIARDVRAVLPQATGTKSSSTTSSLTSGGNTSGGTGTATATSSNSTSSTTSSSSTESDPYRNAFGMLGGSDWLQIYSADYPANLDDTELAASGGSLAQASMVIRVTYSLSYLTTAPDKKGRTQRLGLARSQVASIGAERLDSGPDDSDYRATTDFLCDDLAQLQFQYWDDSTLSWVDSWGIDTPIAPPRAVKVIISLLPPDEYLQSQLGLTGGQSTWSPNYQLIIPITTWVPESESLGESTGTTGGKG